MTRTDTLVEQYLERLRQAAHAMPPAPREELLAQVREHLDAARAELESDDEVGIREVLERLGAPEDIVAEARYQDEPVGPPRTTGRTGRTPAFEIVAVILLLVGGFAIGVGWVAGLVMLWASTRWNVWDKVVGTLVWPGGLATVFLLGFMTAGTTGTTCTGSDGVETCDASGFVMPQWLGIAILVGLMVAPVVVAIYLLRRARGREPIAG